jgi:hypothetical protein
MHAEAFVLGRPGTAAALAEAQLIGVGLMGHSTLIHMPKPAQAQAELRAGLDRLGLLGVELIYFNAARPHQGIARQIPVSGERKSPVGSGFVVSVAVLGGLHHDYRVAA